MAIDCMYYVPFYLCWTAMNARFEVMASTENDMYYILALTCDGRIIYRSVLFAQTSSSSATVPPVFTCMRQRSRQYY
eukprot:scaffold522542_cov35-Prasinocladus_malaysianus.AAC.1